MCAHPETYAEPNTTRYTYVDGALEAIAVLHPGHALLQGRELSLLPRLVRQHAAVGQVVLCPNNNKNIRVMI